MYMLIFANRIIVSYVCGIDVVFQFVDWFAAHVVFVTDFQSNIVMRVLASHRTAKILSEKIMLLINREG